MHERQRTGPAILRYEAPVDVEAVLECLREHGSRARIIAGGTDLIRELTRGEQPGPEVLVDVTRIRELEGIRRGPAGELRIGALVTYNQLLRNSLAIEKAFPLAQACLEVGTPQIRNQATLAGALLTASPSSDIAPALVALGALVSLRDADGERKVPVAEFLSESAVSIRPLLTEIILPLREPRERGIFVKLRARGGQSVAWVNLVILIRSDAQGRTEGADFVVGGVGPAPTIAETGSAALLGHRLDGDRIALASAACAQEVEFRDDVHASASHRRQVLQVMVRRGLAAIREGAEKERWPARIVTLAADPSARPALPAQLDEGAALIDARVNGRAVTKPADGRLTLLSWLRESVGLTGTKEGCGEGVCGSCTVMLDGKAVLACLVPAAQARGREIRTVEGLGEPDSLHPLQQAFLDQGAVQCGFCTPGFLVTGNALLQEFGTPTGLEVEEAYAGNLCRCTGYAGIRRALQRIPAAGPK